MVFFLISYLAVFAYATHISLIHKAITQNSNFTNEEIEDSKPTTPTPTTTTTTTTTTKVTMSASPVQTTAEEIKQIPDPKLGDDQAPPVDDGAAKLATNMAEAIEQALDRLKPFLKMITEECDKANKTPKEDLDEDALVNKVKPLIEEATNILNETLGRVKGMDPTGEIAANAQKNSAVHKASPEEQRLAKALATLTGDVTKTIENAKEKIKDMPKAGPKLGALLGLLQDPLFQILSAVGLLLNGVLTLVGNLLDGLGLGGILRGVLAGLGLDKILKGLGLGKIMGTGKKQ